MELGNESRRGRFFRITRRQRGEEGLKRGRAVESGELGRGRGSWDARRRWAYSEEVLIWGRYMGRYMGSKGGLRGAVRCGAVRLCWRCMQMQCVEERGTRARAALGGRVVGGN